jgi:hypothetical protein
MSVMSVEGDKTKNLTIFLVCVVLGSHDSEYEKYCLVGCDAMYSGCS